MQSLLVPCLKRLPPKQRCLFSYEMLVSWFTHSVDEEKVCGEAGYTILPGRSSRLLFLFPFRFYLGGQYAGSFVAETVSDIRQYIGNLLIGKKGMRRHDVRVFFAVHFLSAHPLEYNGYKLRFFSQHVGRLA